MIRCVDSARVSNQLAYVGHESREGAQMKSALAVISFVTIGVMGGYRIRDDGCQ